MKTSRGKLDNVFDCMFNCVLCGMTIACAVALAAVLVTVVCLSACGGREEIADDDDVATIETAPEPAPSSEYVVQHGDSLWTIGLREGVDYLQIAVTNRAYLVAKYDERCTQLLGRYRIRHKRGWYCNDRRADTWANSLKPGDLLDIPEALPAEAPPEIKEMIEIVENAPEPIALVIDDTGSMSDDRQVVMGWYLAIAHDKGKEVTGVWLYSNGNVEYVNPRGTVTLSTTGGIENTFGALSEAAGSRPRPASILLVTDEQGDDWDWSRVNALPPVFGHCLPEGGYIGCEENLQRLARETGGGYIRGASR